MIWRLGKQSITGQTFPSPMSDLEEDTVLVLFTDSCDQVECQTLLLNQFVS